MPKVTYIVSDIDKALAFEWIARKLPGREISLHFVLLNSRYTALESFLLDKGVPVTRIFTASKITWGLVFIRLLAYLLFRRPDVVHCHLRTAELLGIPAAYLAGIRKRVFTRHSGNYNHIYHPKGVWLDLIINSLATDIVAISENVRNILVNEERAPVSKVHLIHHGFDFGVFRLEKRNCTLFARHNIPPGRKIIGIVSRFTWWKGFAYSIPAIGNFMKQRPEYFLVLANARGNNAHEIRALIRSNLNEENYREIEFEPDLGSLYSLFDIHVHVPFNSSVEAFGQTYVEALISGVPSIFTFSGVAPEFIRHEYNALVVDFKNSEQIESALFRLADEPELCNWLIENGYKSVEGFRLSTFITKLERLYIDQ